MFLAIVRTAKGAARLKLATTLVWRDSWQQEILPAKVDVMVMLIFHRKIVRYQRECQFQYQCQHSDNPLFNPYSPSNCSFLHSHYAHLS